MSTLPLLPSSASHRAPGARLLLAAIALAGLAALALVGDRVRVGHALGARLDAAERSAALFGTDRCVPLGTGEAESGPFTSLASWQTIAGCGAGASTGTGGGIKWVGRSVTGGLFQAQCQANYVKLDDGYTYVVSTQVNRDLGDKWNLGVNVPWLYKYWRDPYGFGFDISNQGPGDTSVMVTRRLGRVNATSLTLSLGIPTGGHAAQNRGSTLRQDKQMGHGKYTGGAVLDHTFDADWGLAVLGGTVDYRGGENELKSYRAPSASGYAYVGYLLGPLVPVAGLTVTGIRAPDRDQDRVQDLPLLTVAANASLEWATDYFALLVGASFPFDRKGQPQPWTAGLGLSLSPF